MNELTVNLSVYYGDFALEVNQCIPMTGIVGIFGASGSGKSTLLRAIAGLESTAHGQIILNNKTLLNSKTKQCIKPEKRRIGLVFQDSRLFPHLNVRENLTFAAKRCIENKLNIDDIIEFTVLNKLVNKKISQLSGGEQQRVALARALLSEPELLLLDEPLSALDRHNKSLMLTLLNKVQKELNIPVLYISHSLAELQQVADHLLVMAAGKVTNFGDIHQIIHELNHQWGNNNGIRQQTSLSLPIKKHLPEYGLSSLQLCNEQEIFLTLQNTQSYQSVGSIKTGELLRCFIPANDISITLHDTSDSSIVNHLAATIIALTEQTTSTLVTVNCHNQVFYSLISLWSAKRLSLKIDDSVYIQFKASAVHTLNELGE